MINDTRKDAYNMIKLHTYIKIISIFVLCTLIILSLNYSESYANTTTEEYYVIEVDLTYRKDMYAYAIQHALNYAHYYPDKKFKIVIKPLNDDKSITEYNLEKQLKIYSNTWLYIDDSTKPIVFNKCHDLSLIVSHNSVSTAEPSYGYNGFENITIEGGIWNGKTSYTNGSYYSNNAFNNFRFAHGNGLTIKNLSIINNYSAHHIQIAGVNNFTVTGCTISNYTRASGDTGYKEAIQLDILSSSKVFGAGQAYDDTPMKNVTIKNNKFINLNRGIGTHSMTDGIYFTNVNISNNTFTNIEDYAIAMLNYKNTTISYNTINNVRGGIEFRYAKSNNLNVYQPTTLTKAIDSNAKSKITNNTIKLNTKKDDTYGIRTYGILPKNGVDYSVKNINISSNKISGVQYNGIALDGTTNSKITKNSISFSNGLNSKSLKAVGMYLKNSNSNTVEANTINNSNSYKNVKYGISLYSSSKSNKIYSNKIYRIMWRGISLQDKSSATIYKNTIKNTKETAINIASNSTATINNNSINTAGAHGIYLYNGCKSSSISSNSIYNCGKHGISLSNTKVTGAIQKNNIKAVKQHGIYLNRSTAKYLINNKVTSYKGLGYYITNGSKVTTIKNNNGKLKKN